jgi:hypothetical protein
MENPFDEICQRLLRIENLLFRLQPPKQIDQIIILPSGLKEAMYMMWITAIIIKWKGIFGC